MNKRKLLIDGISIVVGNAILAFGVAYFIIPNNVLTGGVAGLAIAISPLVHVEVDTLITIIISISFILGYLFLGKQFALKTIASSILYPVLLRIMGQITINTAIEPLMASLYGGLCVGLGVGVVFRVGASTGGMDIPPLILQKFTKIKAHNWMILVDGLTILLGLTSYGINAVLTGLVSVYVSSKAVNFVQTLSGQQAKQVLIITDYVDEVLNMIFKTIDRGATLIESQGGYTKERKQIIMTVLLTDQYAQLEKRVKEIDSDAFLIVSDATEVHGDGFYEIS